VACAGGGAEGHGLVGEGACVHTCVCMCVCVCACYIMVVHVWVVCMLARQGAGGLGLVVKIDVTVAVEVGWKWSVCVCGVYGCVKEMCKRPGNGPTIAHVSAGNACYHESTNQQKQKKQGNACDHGSVVSVG